MIADLLSTNSSLQPSKAGRTELGKSANGSVFKFRIAWQESKIEIRRKKNHAETMNTIR